MAGYIHPNPQPKKAKKPVNTFVEKFRKDSVEVASNTVVEVDHFRVFGNRKIIHSSIFVESINTVGVDSKSIDSIGGLVMLDNKPVATLELEAGKVISFAVNIPVLQGSKISLNLIGLPDMDVVVYRIAIELECAF